MKTMIHETAVPSSNTALDSFDMSANTPALPVRVLISVALYTLLPAWLALAMGWAELSGASRFRPLTLVLEMTVYFSGLYFLFSNIRETVLSKLSPLAGSLYAAGLIFFPVAAFCYYRGEFASFGAIHEVGMVLLPAVITAVLLLKTEEKTLTSVMAFFMMTLMPLFVVNEILSPLGTPVYLVAKNIAYSVFIKAANGLAVATLLVYACRRERLNTLLYGMVGVSVLYDAASATLFMGWGGVTPGLPLGSVALALFGIFNGVVKSPRRQIAYILTVLAMGVVGADFIRAIPEAQESWAQGRFFLDALALLVLSAQLLEVKGEK